jgi:putative acetyltransferase
MPRRCIRGNHPSSRSLRLGDVPEGAIGLDDPRAPDVLALLGRHLAFANQHTPPEDIHALDVDGLLDPAITFFSYRSDGSLLAVGALKRLNAEQAELKSMHTAQEARGLGIGRAMVTHLLDVARGAGYRVVKLETGSGDAFFPAGLCTPAWVSPSADRSVTTAPAATAPS